MFWKICYVGWLLQGIHLWHRHGMHACACYKISLFCAASSTNCCSFVQTNLSNRTVHILIEGFGCVMCTPSISSYIHELGKVCVCDAGNAMFTRISVVSYFSKRWACSSFNFVHTTIAYCLHICGYGCHCAFLSCMRHMLSTWWVLQCSASHCHWRNIYTWDG